jgi:hypothetical protein
LRTFFSPFVRYESASEAMSFQLNCSEVGADGRSGGCTGTNVPDGQVTVTVSQADRKRLKLPSRRLAQAGIRSFGGPSNFAAVLSLSKTERSSIKAARNRLDRQGKTLTFKAVVVYKATQPFARTLTERVTLTTGGPARTVTSCTSTGDAMPCPR